MFSRTIRTILIYFKYFGLGYEVPNETEIVTAGTIVVVHSIGLVVNVVSMYYIFSQVSFIPDALGLFIEMCKYSTTILSFAMIIVESYAKRRSLRRIWTMYAELVECCHHNNAAPFKRFLIYFMGYFALVICVESYVLPQRLNDPRLLHFWLLYFVLLMMGRTRILQYLLHVEMVRYYLVLLKCQMKELLNIQNEQMHDTNILNQQLRHMRQFYARIFDMTVEIDEFFGWSQVLNILQALIHFIVDFNWVYWLLFDERTDIIFGEHQ